MMLFCKSACPTANLSGNNLVLSLPDAMTPVVWMIDTKENGSFFIRVEKDENGLFILQKVEGTGKNVKIEDIAFYADRQKAVKAMSAVGKVIDGSRTPAATGGSVWKFVKFAVAVAAFTFVMLTAIGFAMLKGWMGGSSSDITAADQTPPPYVGENPNSVGVPLSADDYLNHKNKVRLPF